MAPAILAYVAYNPDSIDQTPQAEEGILWLVCVIPAALLLLAMFIISKYELSDEKIDQINKVSIAARRMARSICTGRTSGNQQRWMPRKARCGASEIVKVGRMRPSVLKVPRFAMASWRSE